MSQFPETVDPILPIMELGNIVFLNPFCLIKNHVFQISKPLFVMQAFLVNLSVSLWPIRYNPNDIIRVISSVSSSRTTENKIQQAE